MILFWIKSILLKPNQTMLGKEIILREEKENSENNCIMHLYTIDAGH